MSHGCSAAPVDEIQGWTACRRNGSERSAEGPQLLDRTAPGWSCLFTAPLNRAHPAIEIIARVVNTDRYASLISFPLIVTGPDGLYPLEKGMPLVQVIPFRRDAAFASAQIRSETDEETAERERIRRSVSHPCTRGALLRPR